MATDPERQLKEADVVELVVAAEMQRGHRNAAAFLAVVGFIVIWWENWNGWTFIIPAIIGLYALLRHANIMLINRELNRRPGGTDGP